MRKSRSTSLSTKSRGAFVFVLILCHLAASPNETSALGQIAGQKKDSTGQRVHFRIVTRVTDSESEETISEAVVEGPNGTDFSILLNGTSFRMRARFMTDLIGPNLNMRAHLETRRHLGDSVRGLPLYEEDVQKHRMDVGLEETVVLRPFGGAVGEEGLQVEIEPSISSFGDSTQEGSPPLNIRILKQSPDGKISIRARRVPHFYDVVAELVSDGGVVGRAAGTVVLEEPARLQFRGTAGESQEEWEPLGIDFTVEEFARSRPEDHVTFRFDVRGDDALFANNWAGGAWLGATTPYRLEDLGLELRIRVTVSR